MDETLEHLLFLARRFEKSDIRYVVIILLMELGVPTQCDGFDYLVSAIVICVQDPARVVTEGLYNLITEQYGDAEDMWRIEHSIRRAVESAWQKGETKAWEMYFTAGQNRGTKKPTNVEFISRLARTIELWMGCCDTYEKKAVGVEDIV